MEKTVSAVDARQKFGDLLNRVSIAQEEIIIVRAGKRLAKLVPCDVVEAVPADVAESPPDTVEQNPPAGRLDFRTSSGLGKNMWKEHGGEGYVEKERSQWE